MLRFLSGLICLTIFGSCAAIQQPSGRKAQKIQQAVARSAVFEKSFSGFSLYDPVAKKTLASFNSNHYFIPASNTKILTLAACLALLPDTLPGMQLIQAENRLLIRGTADPTFLHPKFQQWQTCLDTLRSPAYDSLSIYYVPRDFQELRFAPGWAWEDYNEAFQPERTEMPIYGNCVQISSNGADSTRFQPSFSGFKHNFRVPGQQTGVIRQEFENNWTLEPGQRLEQKSAPMHAPPLVQLLGDTLHRPVLEMNRQNTVANQAYQIRQISSAPLDTVLRRMMYQSDNFMAEQLLLMCAGVKFDQFLQEPVINWVLDSLISNIPQRPKWVDGSGLSRYNLMSPEGIIQVLDHLWQNYPRERLLHLFPAGGQQGTIGEWYAGPDGQPYVFAKTGSMGGVQCLSGYVVCKSGKVLIFSFMHNNFVGSGKPWKAEMQRILEMIRQY